VIGFKKVLEEGVEERIKAKIKKGVGTLPHFIFAADIDHGRAHLLDRLNDSVFSGKTSGVCFAGQKDAQAKYHKGNS